MVGECNKIFEGTLLFKFLIEAIPHWTTKRVCLDIEFCCIRLTLFICSVVPLLVDTLELHSLVYQLQTLALMDQILQYQDTRYVVCHAAKEAGPVCHTVSISTGRTKMQFSCMHSSMSLSEKHANFAL